MRFLYGRQDMVNLARAQERCWLLTNGLGGYASTSTAFSVTRGDQGLLMSAKRAPTERYLLVHRIREILVMGKRKIGFSTQEFADGKMAERGYRYLSSFVFEDRPKWTYEVAGMRVTREIVMRHEANTVAVYYKIMNNSGENSVFYAEPAFVCQPKGKVRKKKREVFFEKGSIRCDDLTVYVKSNGKISPMTTSWEELRYADDAVDGRQESGLAFRRLQISMPVIAGQSREMEIIFSDQEICVTGNEILTEMKAYRKKLESTIKLQNPVARQLAISADAYISRRDSTHGKTIIAGYPFFGDWGRDTMIAFHGCILSTGNVEAAESILETFLKYEKHGLVPNLFPEGNQSPRYNTVDAPLLLINCVWLYYQRTGNRKFVASAYPTLINIISSYQKGTLHGIHMDEDGLIAAGKGKDQVTWMDVCINGILPTPRHGKPVEVNAYWYNALMVLASLAEILGQDGEAYALLAEKVKNSFVEKFWMVDKGYLRDVISGTDADQQIRCNQIWAVTMPFSMLSHAQESQLVKTVYRHLYTPCGLRTLSPEDPQFHAIYGGPQKERDLAYHQGTVWVFPLGAFYRAYLKVYGYSREAAAFVRDSLEYVLPMLREGCIGQLPEIYDGLIPGASKGCFAQAWSVGEILTVYELLEGLEGE